jgi:hypothetical protein
MFKKLTNSEVLKETELEDTSIEPGDDSFVIFKKNETKFR